LIIGKNSKMPLLKKEKVLSNKSLFLKICSFCAYQERTQNEVRSRLHDYGADEDLTEELIAELITENFINEERFARTYAGSKFRLKKWGRNKITKELENKEISPYCIRKGLEEIDSTDYTKTLKALLDKKNEEEKEPNLYKRKYKLSLYAIRKGYEPELVWETINDLF